MPLSQHKHHSLLRSDTPAATITATQKIRRRLLVYASVLLALFAVSLYWTYCRRPAKEHEKLARLSCDLIAFELSDNSLSLHYTMAHPETISLISSYGSGPAQASLPVYGEHTAAETENVYTSFMTRLSDIDVRRLTPHDVWIYRILEQSINESLTGLSMPFYGEPLSPSSGEQTSLLILFAEYRIESVEDVRTYLDTLSCVGNYFDGLLLYEQQKSAAGLFMSDAAAVKVIEQCDTLCTKEQLAEGRHFLQTTFRSRLEALLAAGRCSESELEQYLAENDAILTGIVAPAYARLADGIFLLKGTGTNGEGLCRYEEGARYYETRLASLTGSSRTPEEIMTLLTENFAADYDALYETASALSGALPNQTQALMAVPELLADYSPEEMLEDLRARMKSDFPGVPDTISYEVKPVDDALCPYTSPAFYMVPAIDSFQKNSIYINYGDDPDSLTLYTTLAHEGYPGHLYQNVYHLGDMNEQSLMPLEGILSYGGYAEGWATYVEDLSYTYAAQLMSEISGGSSPRSASQPADSMEPIQVPDSMEPSQTPDSIELPQTPDPMEPSQTPDSIESPHAPDPMEPSQTPDSIELPQTPDSMEPQAVTFSEETFSLLCDFYRIDRRIQLCLYSMLDVSIHYYGMTRDEAQTLLNAYGIDDADVINSIYDYIVEEPVNYLKYYLGYLEIITLKEEAKEAWGDTYSDMRFHTAFLSSGPAPFPLLREAVLTFES